MYQRGHHTRNSRQKSTTAFSRYRLTSNTFLGDVYDVENSLRDKDEDKIRRDDSKFKQNGVVRPSQYKLI